MKESAEELAERVWKRGPRMTTSRFATAKEKRLGFPKIRFLEDATAGEKSEAVLGLFIVIAGFIIGSMFGGTFVIFLFVLFGAILLVLSVRRLSKARKIWLARRREELLQEEGEE